VGSLASIGEAKIGRSRVVLTLLPTCANDEPKQTCKRESK